MGSSKYTFPNTCDNYEVMNCMYVHCKIVSSSSTLIQYSNPAELKISNWRRPAPPEHCLCVCVCVWLWNSTSRTRSPKGVWRVEKRSRKEKKAAERITIKCH